MRSGLEVLLDDVGALRGLRVGLCCNHTAINRDLDHALPLLVGAGVKVARVFGPEHGVEATAQDMISVDQEGAVEAGPPVVSLYGETEDSLHPKAEHLADVEGIEGRMNTSHA